MTKSYTVYNFIPQLRVVFPSFKMMGLQLLDRATSPTGEVVSFKDIPAPLLVLVGTSTPVIIFDSLAGVSTFFTTELYFKMTTSGIKAYAAKVTGQLFSCSGVAPPFLQKALSGTYLINAAPPSSEDYSTDDALGVLAIIAVLAFWVIYYKVLATLSALPYEVIPGWWRSVGAFVNSMLETRLAPGVDSLGASWIWALLNRWHSDSKIKLPRRLGAVVEAATQKALGGAGRIIASIQLNKKCARMGYCYLDTDIIAQLFFLGNFTQSTGLTPRLISTS